MRAEQKLLAELNAHIEDQFQGVFEGPARAYFEVGRHRGVYRLWALGTKHSEMVPELFDKAKLHLEKLREVGGVMFVYRRATELSRNDEGVHLLSMRFCVMDENFDAVAWPELSECLDGVPARIAHG